MVLLLVQVFILFLVLLVLPPGPGSTSDLTVGSVPTTGSNLGYGLGFGPGSDGPSGSDYMRCVLEMQLQTCF